VTVRGGWRVEDSRMAECGHVTNARIHCTSVRCAGKSFCPECYSDARHVCVDPSEPTP
jgi:hypothetical protein